MRRIVAAIALIAFLSAVFGIIWGIVQGIQGIDRWIHRGDINAISRQAAPTPRQAAGVSDCSSDDISLELKASPATVGVGGTVQFTATIHHKGSENCLVDASDASRVLTISSGDQTIWKSDLCPVSTRMLLLSHSDSDIQNIAWNTDATGSSCQPDSSLLRVNAGTYQAQLSMRHDSKISSNQVPIVVQ